MSKALVLGGGGPVGIAWETGLIAGLAEAGVALHHADFILGTSAGSVVGSQLALGRQPDALLHAEFAAAEAAKEAQASRGEGGSCGHHHCTSGRCAASQACSRRALNDCGDERNPCR